MENDTMKTYPEIEAWKVKLPPYDDQGVLIEQFTITEEVAHLEQMRALFNPQRSNRAPVPGEYTRLIVDGVLWMTDTPAEIGDHAYFDSRMHRYKTGGGTLSVLIAGLGIGMILNRAIAVHGANRVDVVEIEQRIIDAVGPHYTALAKEHGTDLYIHHADIHKWRYPKDRSWWDLVWLDIWPTISADDRPEVARLRRRFRSHAFGVEAWGQDERNAQARRIRNKTGWY